MKKKINKMIEKLTKYLSDQVPVDVSYYMTSKLGNWSHFKILLGTVSEISWKKEYINKNSYIKLKNL